MKNNWDPKNKYLLKLIRKYYNHYFVRFGGKEMTIAANFI